MKRSENKVSKTNGIKNNKNKTIFINGSNFSDSESNLSKITYNDLSRLQII